MSFEVEGKLIKKFDTENKTETFQTREFVIEIASGNYPQFIKFQLTQDRCGLIDSYSVDDMIKVYFDLRGREWNEKYFTNLNAWRVENAGVQKEQVPIQSESSFPEVQDELTLENMDDDLPF